VDLSRQLDDKRETAFGLTWLGRLAIMEEAPDAARPYLEESLSLARELGDRATTFHALHALAIAASQQGELGAAVALDEEALVLGREIRGALQIYLATLALANAAIEQGNLAAARQWLAENLANAHKHGSHIVPSLQVFAHLAAVQAQPERALRLAGAAAAAHRDAGGSLPPRVRAVIQRRLEAARQSLDEKTAAAAWAEGQAMDLHAAMVYALAVPNTAAGAPGTAGCLTRREREVAVLLGRGLTNQQIAASLVITPGTAKRHVENILTKLDLNARAQVAAWAAQQGWLGDDAPAT
jgi:non-specific serine/threonine protein kinase